MGLFDKLFGGGKQPTAATPADASTESAAPAARSGDASGGAPPPRRERSKPQPAGLAGITPPAQTPDAPADDVPVVVPDDAENVALLRAIGEIVKADNPDSRRLLYQSILDAQLYLVSMGHDDLGEKGEIILSEGQQLALATIRDGKGAVFLPAFTDVERMSRTLPEDARYLRISAMAACRMFLQGGGEGIVINPGQPPSGVITRGEAEILANGVVPEIDEGGGLRANAPKEMKIAIGKLPTTPAESFLDAIRTAAAAQPMVAEIHLFQASIQDQPPRQMIGVLIDEGIAPEQMHPAFEAIGKAAFAARGSETDAFDMMPLNGEMIESIRPLEGVVYSRSQQV